MHENQIIAVQDLNTEGVGRSAWGAREAPGRNVRAKAGLNRSVKAAALGELCRQLEYKAAWHGRAVVVVERWFPSSKRCGACGDRHERLRLADRRWRCPVCGAEHDRDVNAARNIEAEGLRILMPPEDTGGCASGGEGEGPEKTGPVAVSV